MGVVVVWWMLIWSWNFWRKPREHVPATSLTKSTLVGSPRELLRKSTCAVLSVQLGMPCD